MPTSPAESATAQRLRVPDRAAPFWDYSGLLAFSLLLLWPLCMGRALYWGDVMLYFAPMLRFQQMAFAQGHMPLWNPTILGGQPLIGNPQMGVFYPATLLLRVLPVWLYLSLTTIVHVFLCGAFMYAYLRGWSGDRWARMAGSLVYMGSECLIGRIQFPPMIFSAPYFPLLLLSIDRCLDAEISASSCQHLVIGKRLGAYLRLSLVIGLLMLAAHPQMAYLIFASGSLYALARLWLRTQRLIYDEHRNTEKKPRQMPFPAIISIRIADALPKACRLFSAGILGLMLASVQILPAIQVLLESPREKLSPAQANRFYLEPAHLLRLVLPRFWGHPASADFWGSGNAWEPAFFIGWLPLLLIGAACLRSRSRRKVRFWMAAALVGIWLAFGNMGGLYWLAFKTVPGLSNFHDPARFLIYTVFAFAVLTALGWEAYKPVSTNNWARCLALFVIALPLWWAGKDWNPTVPHEFSQFRSQFLDILPTSLPITDKGNAYGMEAGQKANSRLEYPVASGRIYLPAQEQVWKHYITDGYSDYGSDDARHYQALLDTLMSNMNTQWGVESAFGYEPVPLSAPISVEAQARLAARRGEPNLARLSALMGADTLILPQQSRSSDPRFTPIERQKDVRLTVRAWRNRDALPRAWIVRCVRRVEGKSRLNAALSAPDFIPDQVVLLQDKTDTREQALLAALQWPYSQEAGANTGAKSRQTQMATHVQFRDSQNIVLETDCGLKPGFLVVGISAFPGWQAEVDMKPNALHRVDGALMGLYLPPGQHSVTLRYRPACYEAGLYLSLLAAAIMSAMTGYRQLQRIIIRN